MTLNELLFILVIIGLLMVPSLLGQRIRQPMTTYINLSTGLLLLVIVWSFKVDGSLPLRVIMTAVVLKGAFKTIREYQEYSGQVENTK